MNQDANPILTLLWTFALMSLFAVGGANAAIPEMHRVAVDVRHWMTDKQFADIFAISQMAPGPNVLIVTLIGYAVAGVVGALIATLAMCVPTAVLAKWHREAEKDPSLRDILHRIVEYRRHVLAIFDSLVGWDTQKQRIQ